jgi:HK97 gp10 family phage protein
MARQVFRIEGMRELEQALGELPKATGKAVLRRVLIEAGEPIARAARAVAPRDVGTLVESIDVGTKLSRRQRSQHRKMSTVEVHVGPGPNPQAITQEFGTWRHRAQPFMRPAWDAERMNALDRCVTLLGNRIVEAAQRAARKSARLAAKG